MKHRMLLAASLLLLLSTAMQAKRIAAPPSPLLNRLDAVFRLVSTGTSFADGQKSGLLGKKLGYGQYAPKQKVSGVRSERYAWYKSAGRWGYRAELGRFSSANGDQRMALQQKTIGTLNQWAARRGVEPADLSNTASKGTTQTLWVYSDTETKTLVTLVSRYSTSIKMTAVVLRVEAL